MSDERINKSRESQQKEEINESRKEQSPYIEHSDKKGYQPTDELDTSNPPKGKEGK